MVKALVFCLAIMGLTVTGFAATPTSAEATNTKLNQRDADGQTLTPEDQSKGSNADVELTRKIREEIVKNDKLSTDAQNVKIITLGGVVTLRGPVATASEKSQIEGIAKKTAGVKRVDNQIEVKVK
jgi:osmotically-inducible protein OsmY